MSLVWKVFIPIITVVAIAFSYIQLQQEPAPINVIVPKHKSRTSPPAALLPPAPPATGNINDTVAALINDGSNEQALIDEEERDAAALAGNDTQALNDFGQTYNENDF